MSIDVKVPVLPESVSDATVATWYKKPGDFVKRDENLVDLETDKVVLEVPAPADGVLESIAVESGEVVEANDALSTAPETVNSAPEADGWFAKIKVSDAAELDALMDQAAYDEFLSTL